MLKYISLQAMNNERKLVEAFKMFMERGVVPCLPDSHAVLNQWKFLSGIISADPIDYAQIDFYLLMTNKSQQSQQPQQPQQSQQLQQTYNPPQLYRTTSQHQNASLDTDNYNRLTSSEYSPSIAKSGVLPNNKRKNLLASMQAFQGSMIKNQEQLQNYTKKDNNSSQYNTSYNTSVNRSTQGSRKYI